MKFLFVTLVASLLIGCTTTKTVSGILASETTNQVEVLRVIDGDTLDVLISDVAHRVRLFGVDTPERGERCYNEATERLRQLAKDVDVADVVDFVGRDDQEELPVYYSAADVCVVPSFYESFGLAALESMACGTPVVASRVGGLSTIIQHGHTGYLKSCRCPEAFANSRAMITPRRILL